MILPNPTVGQVLELKISRLEAQIAEDMEVIRCAAEATTQQQARIERLETLLRKAIGQIKSDAMAVEWEWGSCRSEERMEEDHDWPDLVYVIRAALEARDGQG